MQVAAPSATAMVKRLAALGLADHVPYRGVRLTRRGERIALEVLRHHRLIELYLSQTLELGLDAVHAEADRLEHALSETLEQRIDEALGSPTEDPHGDPIPDAALRIVQPKARPLTELEPGEQATVQRVPDGDGELLRYLATLGLVPGGRVELLRAEPLDGPLTVRADGWTAAVSRQLAAQIRVSS
jgi:DtxR family Mn-dependent transcriptional regulator